MSESARHPSTKTVVVEDPRANLPATESELPVVARLIVEIRSDGSRTLARGAMEDANSGSRVAIEASGTTPLELALKLAKSMLSAPWLNGTLARGALRRMLGKP